MAIEDNKNIENSTSGGANSASTKRAREEDFSTNNPNNQSGSDGNDIASQVGSVLRGDTGAIKNIYDKAKESSGQVAGQALGKAKVKASSALDEQKSNLAVGLGSVADGIRQVGSNLRDSDEKNDFVKLTAKYGESLAQQIEKFSNYLNRKDLNDLVNDIQNYARRNPAVFVGTAFGIGFVAARFLKSSSPNQSLMPRGNNGGENFNSDNFESNKSPETEAENSKSDDFSTLDTDLPSY